MTKMHEKKEVVISCTGAAQMPLEALTSFQGKLKSLSDQNAQKLKKEILELGFSEPIAIWVKGKTNYILNGHQRVRVLEMMREDGYTIPDLPVVVVEAKNATEAKKKVLALTSQYGKMEFDGLIEFTSDTPIRLKDIADSFSFPELDTKIEREFNKLGNAGKKDDDAVPPLPDKAKSKRGELFQLGEHRILCGDSTDQNDVDKVMGDDRAIVCLTDPPYSIDYQNQRRKPDSPTRKERGDSYVDPPNAEELLTKFIGLIPAEVLVMTYPINLHFHELARSTGDWDMLYECCWVKHHFAFVIGRRYQPQHEPILIFRRRKHQKRHVFNVPPNQPTTFMIDRPSKSKEHPTIKPVELYKMLTGFHSNKHDVVYEPFAGSGTTLIACESLGRQCRAIEISPQYVDLVIKRWEDYTGRKARKL